MRPTSVALAMALLASAALAGVREVELALPVRAKLALTGHEKLYLGPFLRETKSDEAQPRLGLTDGERGAP